MELLAPAGDEKAFLAAVAAGADAIYCGFGNAFNARRQAVNFNEDAFRDCVEKAHLAGVKVFVTMNILVKQHEFLHAMQTILRAFNLGADAFIIQDIGLLSYVRAQFPFIECHVSTQANVHDEYGAQLMHLAGASRVTLSRELSLAEIGRIGKLDIDVEVFGHGAICFCYSGLCGFSHLRGKRSANRGLCAQPCRLEYQLVNKSGKALSAKTQVKPLCPKDMCVYSDLGELVQTGARSLKIEGRMKAPEYVYNVVYAYRQKLNNVLFASKTDEEENFFRLKRSFNRGFTNAYLSGKSSNELMSYERSNNQGDVVGTCVGSQKLPSIKVTRGTSQGGRVRKRTLSQAHITIKLTKPVHKGDLLEVRPKENPQKFQVGSVLSDAHAGDVITITTSAPCPEGSVVRVIRSQYLVDAYEQAVARPYPRLRPIDITVRARLHQPLVVEFTTSDGAYSVTVFGEMCDHVRTKEISQEDLRVHISKLGSTPFSAQNVVVECEAGIGMSFSTIHALRKKATDELRKTILKRDKIDWDSLDFCGSKKKFEHRANEVVKLFSEKLRQAVLDDVAVVFQGKQDQAPEKSPSCKSPKASVYVLCDTGEKASFLQARDDVQVIVHDSTLEHDATEFGYPIWLNEVSRLNSKHREEKCFQCAPSLVISNYSQLYRAVKQSRLFDTSWHIPVFNTQSARILSELGAQTIWLSEELSLQEIIALIPSDSSSAFGIKVFGRNQAMISEHCVLQVANACIEDCKRCRLRTQELYLQDSEGNKYPVYTDVLGRSRIFDSKPLDIVEHIPQLLKAGVAKFLIDARGLDQVQLCDAIERVQSFTAQSRGDRNTIKPTQKPASYTGHLFDPVD